MQLITMSDKYYRVMTGNRQYPVLIFKEFEYGNWCCYYEHEYNYIITHNPLAETPEEAFALFFTYRINDSKVYPIQHIPKIHRNDGLGSMRVEEYS